MSDLESNKSGDPAALSQSSAGETKKPFRFTIVEDILVLRETVCHEQPFLPRSHVWTIITENLYKAHEPFKILAISLRTFRERAQLLTLGHIKNEDYKRRQSASEAQYCEKDGLLERCKHLYLGQKSNRRLGISRLTPEQLESATASLTSSASFSTSSSSATAQSTSTAAADTSRSGLQGSTPTMPSATRSADSGQRQTIEVEPLPKRSLSASVTSCSNGTGNGSVASRQRTVQQARADELSEEIVLRRQEVRLREEEVQLRKEELEVARMQAETAKVKAQADSEDRKANRELMTALVDGQNQLIRLLLAKTSS